MFKNFANIAKAGIVLAFGLCSTGAFADACSTAFHSGTSVTNTANATGTIGDIGYEIWFDSGNNSAPCYSDGSLSCKLSSASDSLGRRGLSYNSDKTYAQLGHRYADFQ